MTIRLAFEVSGTALGKQRPRQVTLRNGRSIWYTPRRTVEYERRVKWTAIRALQERKVAGEPPWPIDARYSLTARIYFGDMRRRDADNVIKLVMDSLTARRAKGIRPAGKPFVWRDDSQVRKLAVESEIDRANPRVEVVIEVMP